MNYEDFYAIRWVLYPLVLAATVGIYIGAVWLFRRVNFALLHPLLVTVAVIIALMIISGLPYEIFVAATLPIDFLLGPTVVALGYALYNQREHLKANLWSIMASVIVGATVGIASVWGVMTLFGAPPDVMVSMLPKSVTNPIAIPLSESLGGIRGLTSVVVVLTGIFGGIVGPTVLRVMGITSKIAKGLAMGSAAHGVGTARAMEMGALEGAIAGLAIGLMGLFTALLFPIVELLLF